MKTRFILTGLLVFFISTGCSAEDPGKTYTVNQVIDGDTIELSGGRRVRYIGIDAPEKMKRVGDSWQHIEESYSKEATDFNRSLTLRKNVTLEFGEEKEDRYGRWLAYIFLDDERMVNLEMVKEGFATLYVIPPNVKYLEMLVAAQEEAIRNKKGLWKSVKSIDINEAGENVGKIVFAEGKVAGVSTSTKNIYINFGFDYKKSLSVIIPNKNLEFFLTEGIDPSTYYKNKTVVVTGKIVFQGSLRIFVGHPSQIRVI